MRRAYSLFLAVIFLALLVLSCGNDRGSPSLNEPKADRSSGNIEVRRFLVQIPYAGNTLEQNIYLLYDKTAKQGLIIDPGAGNPELEAVIDNSGMIIKGILNTHGHFDHTGANELYRLKYQVEVYGHVSDKPLYQNKADEPTRWIEAESNLKLGNFDIHVLPTPGHTEGSVCFLVANHLFSGDSLFHLSIGRTPDRPSTIRLINNIRKKLLSLPASTPVYPGHGETTTIGLEKKDNPFFRDGQGL